MTQQTTLCTVFPTQTAIASNLVTFLPKRIAIAPSLVSWPVTTTSAFNLFSPALNITGVLLSNPITVNLTSEGVLDWIHWKTQGSFKKATGNNSFQEYVNSGGFSQDYPNDPLSYTWSDGSPVMSGSDNGGVYSPYPFQVTIGASNVFRTAKIYVGGYQSGGVLTATVSDGSSSGVTFSGFSNFHGNSWNAVFTVKFATASTGQTLTLTWTCVNNQGGNVTISAATLF